MGNWAFVLISSPMLIKDAKKRIFLKKSFSQFIVLRSALISTNSKEITLKWVKVDKNIYVKNVSKKVLTGSKESLYYNLLSYNTMSLLYVSGVEWPCSPVDHNRFHYKYLDNNIGCSDWILILIIALLEYKIILTVASVQLYLERLFSIIRN